jgi:3'-5' exoribonuclease
MDSDHGQYSLMELRKCLREGPWRGSVRGQIESLQKKESSQGKPFFELRLRDETDALVLRAWSDSSAFSQCEGLEGDEPLEITGEFYENGSFGPDAKRWTLRCLSAEESDVFFAGNPEIRAATEADFDFIKETVGAGNDPRLRGLAEKFLSRYGDRFQRAAAARSFHHARRGGLCQHTAQMMRSALAVAGAYPELNRDLLVTGILFHDSGKLWETCPPERGFDMPVQVAGELLGHISIGIELVNRLWGEMEEERRAWRELSPPSEDVRLHLLHLIASHHGTLEFGSPVEPRTPEAIALHYIDNLDAKLEMMRAGYLATNEVAPGVTDRIRPLNVRLVRPLPSATADANSSNPSTSSDSNP